MAIKRSFILSSGLGVSADNIFVVNNTNSVSSTTGSIISTGGVGIGQSVSISGRLQLFNSSNYTAFVSSASGNTVYILPASSPATGTSVLQSTSAGVMSWVPMTATSGTSGLATTAENINTVAATTNATHYILFSPINGGSGVAVSSDAGLFFNPSSNALTTNTFTAGVSVATAAASVSGSTASTSSSSGALVVTGGVGIGQSVSIGGRLQLFNSSNYTAFVSSASGNTVYILPATSPATGSSVLQSTSAGVMSWVPMIASGAASGFTTLNSLTDGIQFFATGTSGSGFNISSSGSTHTFNIPIAGSGSTGLITTLAQTIAGQKTFSSALNISDTTASTSTSNGALQVAGGVGISGRLSFNQASFGTTGIATNPTIAMIGQTGDPIYMSVLEDNSISFEGAQGQLFSITPNLSTGYIYSVNDITGIPLIRANANANVTANEYAGNFGIGLTNPGYKLHVLGSVGFTSTTVSTSTTTGTLVVGGGVGIGGSLYVASATAISGVTINNGIITGNLTGTATTSGFATTSNYSNQSGYGITAGFATTASNLNVVSAITNSNHPVLFTPTSGSASGVAVSTESSFVYNPSTDILSVSGLAVTAGTSSTSSSTGSIIVSGGVGIGGTLFVGTTIGVNSGTSGLLLQK